MLQEIKESSFFQAIIPDTLEEEHIEPRSAALVYSMSVWKEGKPDPIDNQTFEGIVHDYNLFSPLYLPFREYIGTKYPALAVRVSNNKIS